MPIFEDVLANIGDEQSILEGQSTFSAHVRRIGQILKQSGPGSLVLLDELGTATDPEEGGALAVAILEHLVKNGALTIVSSHLGVLKSWAHSHEHGRNASFRLGEADRRPTYRLALDMVGISEALVVAEQAGLPKEVLDRARGLRPETEGDATALLMSLRHRDTELAQEVEEARRLREDLEQRQREVEEIEAKLRQDRRNYRNQLMGEKERELVELRAQVERMIAKLPRKEDLLATKQLIEEVQASTKKARATEVDETPGSAPRALAPGDLVHVRSLREDGVVQQVDANGRMARVAVGKVVANVRVTDLERKQAPRRSAADEEVKGVVYRRPQFASSVLDLHGVRVEEGIQRADKFIDEALASGLNGVKLMHGQGSGALRRGLHDFLRTHPTVKSYRFATAEEGGGGVTVVEFK